MDKKSFEYIVKVKNVQIDYKIIRKFDFKLFIKLFIGILVALFIYNMFNYDSIKEIMTDINSIDSDISNKIKIMVLLHLGFVMLISLGFGFLKVIYDLISGLNRIKLENNSIVIQKRNKEYIFKYEDLIKIRTGFIGTRRYILRKYGLYIYYLENNEIKEFICSFPRQNLNKIKEICSIFITNNNTENLNESEYYSVRNKEKEEIINKVLNDEIIW